MTYQINCMQEEGYLHVNVSGIRNKANVAQAAVKILKKAVEHNSPLVLVDVCKFEGKLSMLESISVILNLFPKIRKERFLKKALIVDDRKNRQRFRFFETYAVNRGYNLRICDDKDEGLDWLKA